jgi:hypothetical protein
MATTDEQVRALFLDAVVGSVYVPDASKGALTEMVLNGEWPALAKAVGAKEGAPADDDAVGDFRAMALDVFTRSRKVARLPDAHRQRLGAGIAACPSKEALISMMLRTLETAQTLDEPDCARIANDVLDGMFHRLLLPDRFDCNEGPAAGAGADCAICLGVAPSVAEGQLPCGHQFCSLCIGAWSAQHRSGHMPCPICRAETPWPLP